MGIKIGQTVTLKTGGPEMTVLKRPDQNLGYVECGYFDSNEIFHRVELPLEALDFEDEN